MRRLLWASPSLGVIRMEWHNAIASLIMPCNWSSARVTPLNFAIADAQNLVVKELIEGQWEWLWLLEDDTCPPPHTLISFEEHIRKREAPIVSGLYHLKNGRQEPLVYRGRGNGAYWPGPKTWKYGDLVWADGVPTGCLLIHRSILEVQWREAEWYVLVNNGERVRVKRVFETPRDYWIDPGTGQYQMRVGTSDLHWCDSILRNNTLHKAGWKALAKRKHPFLVDTRIVCGHVDRSTGQMF